MGTKLTIELVPETSWFTNLRSMFSRADWDVLRRYIYKTAGYKCEICNGVGNKHPVECHEVWNYDDKKHKQTLIDLIALCPRCHEVKHIGLARVRGRNEYAERHLASINKWNSVQTQEYIDKAFSKWELRSQYDWKVDISFTNSLLKKLKERR
jgi:hypothetical protein